MDKKFLLKAIDAAEKNVDLGGGPFGAVIVKDGKIIASAENKVTLSNDPTAHAEILAIRKAAEKLKTWDLSGCQLYSSCEPCPMCLGAVYWAHIDEVFYACNKEDAKEAGFDDSFIYREFEKDTGERKLKMSQDLRERGLKAFEKWIGNSEREEY